MFTSESTKAALFIQNPSSILVLALCLGIPARAQTNDFSIIALSDLHTSIASSQILQAQMKWIVDNRAARNIQAVVGLGDIVNDSSDDSAWGTADAAFRLLDAAQIPYFVAIGNHDYDNEDPQSRLATNFNRWFGPQRFSAYSWYRGHYPANGNENSYGVINIESHDYLILVLETVPRDVAVNWAAPIVAGNAGMEVLLDTHSFMYSDGTRVDQCDTQDLNADNYGEKLWSKFASQYANISNVLSGHITNAVGSRRSYLGIKGNLVNQMLSNYQSLGTGGNGFLRILTFHPAANTITVQTYSPYLNAYRTEDASQFTIPWHAPAVTTTTGKVSGLVRDVKTCTQLACLTVAAGASSAVTDGNGKYSLTLPGGSYQLSSSGSGWVPSSLTAKINNGYNSEADFFVQCALSSLSPSVTICTPQNNATVTSPVKLSAGSTDTKIVSYMQLYVDGVKQLTAPGGTLNTSVTLAAGSHRLTVQAKDSAGTLFHKTVNILVSNSTSSACTAGPV